VPPGVSQRMSVSASKCRASASRQAAPEPCERQVAQPASSPPPPQTPRESWWSAGRQPQQAGARRRGESWHRAAPKKAEAGGEEAARRPQTDKRLAGQNGKSTGWRASGRNQTN